MDKSDQRWELIRDVASLQLKLLADGLRDFLLSPVSVLAGLAGLVFRPSDPAHYFRRVMALGLASERWINLFGRYSRRGSEASIDQLLARVEAEVSARHARGGLTAQTRAAIDRSLDFVHQRLDAAAPDAKSPD